MTIAAAMRLGVRCRVLDKDPNAPAALYTSAFKEGDARDFETVVTFANGCDALTIDSEHVSAEALSALEAKGLFTVPQGNILTIIQNKCRQKEFFEKQQIPTAPFKTYKNKEDLLSHLWDLPFIQKKATAGYDGSGVQLIQCEEDLKEVFDGESLVEKKISIAKEIAVIVVTDRRGNFVHYDPVEMVFDAKKNILRYQLCPADIGAKLAKEAQRLAVHVAKKLGVVGLLAVEMFLTTDGELLVNELAPRPHNSGHHTIEGAATSQYENLLRVLLDLPLGNAATTTPTLMLNLLGPQLGHEKEFENLIAKSLAIPHASLHWYGKKDMRPFRKLGHITLCGDKASLLSTYNNLLGL
ncbi:MAG: N5-carboxyaminoimidazole ribonucleotide synthase [Turneriella sp.]|nr:N5-carboxyaminoimidazole ribonucleotide synthase [Turneriella sp.]